MRSLIIGLVVFLSACNGSDKTIQVPYSDPALVAKVDSLTKALAAATHEDAMKFSKFQIFAPTGVKKGSEFTNAISSGINFGPCTDGGIQVGASGITGSDNETQVFKQTPTSTCPGVYSEYDVATGMLHTTHRVYYITPDCSGQAYIWDAGGQGIDRLKTEAGISFISPNPSDGGQMWVAPGTSSAITQAESVYIPEDGGCTSDGDLQPMWQAVQTTTSISGVALSLGANYQLNGIQ